MSAVQVKAASIPGPYGDTALLQLRDLGKSTEGAVARGQRLADCKSAIQQIENLRYAGL